METATAKKRGRQEVNPDDKVLNKVVYLSNNSEAKFIAGVKKLKIKGGVCTDITSCLKTLCEHLSITL